MRLFAAVALLMIAPTAAGHEVSQASSAAAAAMRLSAERVLTTLSPAARATVTRPFNDRDRVDWHYTPRSRNGVALKELDARGRDAVHALLKSALSTVGYGKVVNIIELELVLREIETFGLMRDPERYHVTIYGAPSETDAWGWRFEGHHLSLNFTLAGDHVAVDAPSFLGANPAKVPKGPRAGQRMLAAEEDEARSLLASLSESQRREAVFDTRTYGDIVTGNAEKADPPALVGIAASGLSDAQRAQLLKLIEVYARTFEPSLAEARMKRVRDGGVETVRFGWAGATERGRQHYYRVQGPLFLIEYDASQDGGNHIHTVWRDFNGDFGRDLLREHYQAAKGTAHRHTGRSDPAT
ncbi:MAG: DUF3500 domain-containing protein [Betaproteobacteria bacterium]